MSRKNKKEKPELTEREAAKRERLLELLRYLVIGTATTVINWGMAALMREAGVTVFSMSEIDRIGFPGPGERGR